MNEYILIVNDNSNNDDDYKNMFFKKAIISQIFSDIREVNAEEFSVYERVADQVRDLKRHPKEKRYLYEGKAERLTYQEFFDCLYLYDKKIYDSLVTRITTQIYSQEEIERIQHAELHQNQLKKRPGRKKKKILMFVDREEFRRLDTASDYGRKQYNRRFNSAEKDYIKYYRKEK